MAAEKLDMFKQHREQYRATKNPRLVELPPVPYLCAEGYGKPGGPEFEALIGALYGVAYTVKFMMKERGRDYVVGKLEGIWWFEGGEEVPAEAAAEMDWHYKLLSRVPDFVTADDLDRARAQLADKGKRGPFDRVGLEVIDEGIVVQALHIGTYASEDLTIAAMHEFARSEGCEPKPGHHEIYLSDPRRVEPDRLKTILRQPISEG